MLQQSAVLATLLVLRCKDELGRKRALWGRPFWWPARPGIAFLVIRYPRILQNKTETAYLPPPFSVTGTKP